LVCHYHFYWLLLLISYFTLWNILYLFILY